MILTSQYVLRNINGRSESLADKQQKQMHVWCKVHYYFTFYIKYPTFSITSNWFAFMNILYDIFIYKYNKMFLLPFHLLYSMKIVLIALWFKLYFSDSFTSQDSSCKDWWKSAKMP